MSKNKTGKCFTYEEIGEKMDLSPQQVHKIEREAFNKMIKLLSVNNNIFDVVLGLSSYLGLDPDQAYKKLDKQNKDKLSMHIKDHYGMTVEGFTPAASGIEDFFE
jgi:transcriptional regulator with XRE-family HTH domain